MYSSAFLFVFRIIDFQEVSPQKCCYNFRFPLSIIHFHYISIETFNMWLPIIYEVELKNNYISSHIISAIVYRIIPNFFSNTKELNFVTLVRERTIPPASYKWGVALFSDS
jgi:hypothetical protein